MNPPPITTANGLLYRNGEVVHLPEADAVAARHGHRSAEAMVRHLEANHSPRWPNLLHAQRLGGWCVECRNAGPRDMVHYRYTIGHVEKCPDWETESSRSFDWELKDARVKALARINEIETPYART